MDGGRIATPWLGLERARALAAEFATRAAAHDRDGSFGFENIAALADAGLLNLSVPAALGGPGRGLVDLAAVIGTIATGDASTALVLCMQYLQLGSVLRSERWPAHLQARLARESLEGVALVNALRVEPELGTPARGGLPATTATRTAEGWRISGRKIYSTGSPALRYGLVWARTADENPRVGFFLVPMASPGVRIVETWDHLGLRASGSHDVILENVLVPADHAADIRPPGEWAVRDPIQQVWSNVAIAALYDGVARAARDWLVGYLQQRKPANLGAALATLPRFQEAVGEIDALLLTNRALIQTTAEQADRDLDTVPPATAGLVKFTVTGNAIAAVARALELTGNPGLSRANPLERHHRDVLCSRVHSPQNDTLLAAAGRAAFGL
jgi:alkylation response protein AidB-like acyl-CoA dehydrogenase